MLFTRTKQYIVSVVLLFTIATPIYAKPPETAHKHSNKPITVHKPAKPNHKPVTVIHKPVHKPVVVVHKPARRSYHRNNIPKATTFVLVAGISYALINNAYYKNNNDTYEYVEAPIAVASKSSANQGTVVNGVPLSSQTVVINGATYYVNNGDWYAPIAGTNQFVIVAPQV